MVEGEEIKHADEEEVAEVEVEATVQGDIEKWLALLCCHLLKCTLFCILMQKQASSLESPSFAHIILLSMDK